MSKILVSGLINIETTLSVEGFPIGYTPVRFPFFGVHSSVSGVGYNVAKALTVLGDDVRFLSLIGADAAGVLVRAALSADGISAEHVLGALAQTAQSVILFRSGRIQGDVSRRRLPDVRWPRCATSTFRGRSWPEHARWGRRWPRTCTRSPTWRMITTGTSWLRLTFYS
jgi:ribokinase